MNVATKQRLTGTIVLVSLATILIPLLLDGEGVEPPPHAITQTIPAAPIVDTTPLPEPRRPAIVSDKVTVTRAPAAAQSDSAGVSDAEAADRNTAASDAAAPSDSTPERLPAPESSPAPIPAATPEPDVEVAVNTPQLDAQGLPAAWTIQMGMFKDATNAEALLARLLLANYKAYVRPQGGGLTGVFVGPVLTRAEATTLQQQMQSEFGEGLVTRFTIDSRQ